MLVKRINSTPFIDLFLNEFFDYPSLSKSTNLIRKPEYNIVETDDNYELELLLAGIDKNDINLNIENNALIIEAERKCDNIDKYYYKEMYYGKFRKEFTLPDDVNMNEINASLNNGILSIKIPREKKNTKLSKKIIKIE